MKSTPYVIININLPHQSEEIKSPAETNSMLTNIKQKYNKEKIDERKLMQNSKKEVNYENKYSRLNKEASYSPKNPANYLKEKQDISSKKSIRYDELSYIKGSDRNQKSVYEENFDEKYQMRQQGCIHEKNPDNEQVYDIPEIQRLKSSPSQIQILQMQTRKLSEESINFKGEDMHDEIEEDKLKEIIKYVQEQVRKKKRKKDHHQKMLNGRFNQQIMGRKDTKMNIDNTHSTNNEASYVIVQAMLILNQLKKDNNEFTIEIYSKFLEINAKLNQQVSRSNRYDQNIPSDVYQWMHKLDTVIKEMAMLLKERLNGVSEKKLENDSVTRRRNNQKKHKKYQMNNQYDSDTQTIKETVCYKN